jgi:putative nucleotidyltransferase with HDIG domain
MTEATSVNVEQQIHALVGDIHKLPTPPLVFTQISRVIDNEDASAYDVAGIIAEDPAMSAQVLKLANSAYYGLAHPVPHVKQAVIVLGMNEVKNVVLAASAISAFRKSSADREYQDEFWRHSLAVAVGARMLLRTFQAKKILEAETAFSAGLLHDLGKMVVFSYAPEEHQKIQQYLQETGGPDCRAEREILGLDHCQIGAYLAQHWKLPADITSAISYHHTPQESAETGAYDAIVHVADVLAHRAFGSSGEEDNSSEVLQVGCLERLRIPPDDFGRLTVMVVEEYTRSETFLHMAS